MRQIQLSSPKARSTGNLYLGIPETPWLEPRRCSPNSHNERLWNGKMMSRNYPVFNGQTQLEKAVVLRLRIWRARAEGPGRVARRAIYPRIGTSLKISCRHFLRADVAA